MQNFNSSNENNNFFSSLILPEESFTEKVFLLEERIINLEKENEFFKHKFIFFENKVNFLLNNIENSSSNYLFVNKKYLDNHPHNESKLLKYDENSFLSEFHFNENSLKKSRFFSNEIDSLLYFFKPNVRTITNRVNISNFLRHFITRTITCCVFQVDTSILFCNLPNATIKVSVILSSTSSYLSSLYNMLHDRLLEYNNQYISYDNDINIKETNSTLNLNKESKSYNYFISNIKLEDITNKSILSGMINNNPFEISFNSRIDLFFIAFIEKVSILIGKDNLFKRSLLLLNAWWSYENIYNLIEMKNAYNHTDNETLNSHNPRGHCNYLHQQQLPLNTNPIKDILPDFAITFMLISIFNCYAYKISTPLEAFLIFISVYSNFDGKTQAITLQGIKAFESDTNELMYWSSNNFNENYLIPFSLYEEFFNIVNLNGSDKIFGKDTDPVSSASSNEKEIIDIRDKIIRVDRTEFSIIHPFSFNSMTNENLSIKKIDRIQDYLSKTNEKLNDFFFIFKKDCDLNISYNNQNLFISMFFSSTMHKFFINDAAKNMILYKNLDSNSNECFNTNLSELWSNIFCCNFILESVLTESALLTLCTQLLNDKKFLSIGEIGKIIVDVTGINNMSSQLREKYGGLKKFIEKYNDIFLIAKDHNYNPNVSLKKLLTNKQISLLIDGNLQLQSIFKQNNDRCIISNIISTKKNINSVNLDKNNNNSNSNFYSEGYQKNIYHQQHEKQQIKNFNSKNLSCRKYSKYNDPHSTTSIFKNNNCNNNNNIMYENNIDSTLIDSNHFNNNSYDNHSLIYNKNNDSSIYKHSNYLPLNFNEYSYLNDSIDIHKISNNSNNINNNINYNYTIGNIKTNSNYYNSNFSNNQNK